MKHFIDLLFTLFTTNARPFLESILKRVISPGGKAQVNEKAGSAISIAPEADDSAYIRLTWPDKNIRSHVIMLQYDSAS